jgi:hypothetical protein
MQTSQFFSTKSKLAAATMAYSYGLPAAGNYADLVIISDSEDIYSISDDDYVQQEANNCRLSQAIHYIEQEGGDDLPSTFMDRVNRIDETLLGQLAQQGRNFDPELYRQLRALIIEVMDEYDNAAQEQSLNLDSNEDLAEIYTPTAYEDVEALYRGASSDLESPSPAPAPRVRGTSKTLASRSPGTEDNIERERKYKYGRTGENEMWYKDFPAILPFPETLMMAHWESLKIDFDLNHPKEAATAETIVPLEHYQLQPYFELPQYESGSRFKLPHVSEEDHIAIQKLGTAVNLRKAVDKYFEVNQTDDKNAKHAPRVFLQKLNVGYQRKFNHSHQRLSRAYEFLGAPDQYVTPEQIRASLASSPTKSRTAPLSISNAEKTKKIAKTAAYASPPKVRVVEQPKTRVFRRISHEVRLAESEDEIEHPATFSTRPKSPVIHPATFSTKPKPKPTPPATLSTKPKATTPRVTVEIPKKRPGRPRKNPPPAEATAVVSTEEPHHAIPASKKRKPSIGSQPYETPVSSIKKVLRDTKKRKLSEAKSVEFVEAPITLEEDSEDPNYPGSPVRKPARVAKGGKAAAAGKASKGKKTAGVTGSGMATRSGASYC